jgi:phage gp16-like protein
MALSKDPVVADCQKIRFKATKAGMTEDQYKDWLQQQFGVKSSRDLNTTQRSSAHGRLNKLLDAVTPDRGGREPQIQKLEALWRAIADKGVVRNPSTTALETWCKRQMPTLSALRFGTKGQLQALIEILKKWALRVGAEVI